MVVVFLSRFIEILFQVLFYAILGRTLMSWFSIREGNPFYPLVVILHQITEPILGPLRRVIPTIGILDITPIVALFLLQFIQVALITALLNVPRG